MSTTYTDRSQTSADFPEIKESWRRLRFCCKNWWKANTRTNSNGSRLRQIRAKLIIQQDETLLNFSTSCRLQQLLKPTISIQQVLVTPTPTFSTLVETSSYVTTISTEVSSEIPIRIRGSKYITTIIEPEIHTGKNDTYLWFIPALKSLMECFTTLLY